MTIMNTIKIGFIGLGKLGLPCAAAISSKLGTEIIGYDINSEVSKYINSAEVPYLEKDVDYYLKNSRITTVDSIRNVVEYCDLVFVAVQTPHDKEYEGCTPVPSTRKDFDYSHLEGVIREIAAALEQTNKRISLSIICTVLPGTMRARVLPLLNKVRDRVDFSYNPFFIAMGQTISDFLNPEFILIGNDKDSESTVLQNFYRSFQSAPIVQMQIESAELTKVAYNTFIGFKIVFANTLGEILENLGRGNVDEVTNALSKASERLISGKYLTAGMGDGGGCHPRDQIAMSWIANSMNLSTDPFTFLAKSRDNQTLKQAELIKRISEDSQLDKIVIMGESYKANINLTVGSPALLLQHYLHALELDFSVFDPFVYPDCHLVDEPTIFFIATNHDSFRKISFPENSIVIDPWGDVCNPAIQHQSIKVIMPGRNHLIEK